MPHERCRTETTWLPRDTINMALSSLTLCFLSVCLPVSLSLSLSLCVCLSVSLSLCLSVSLSVLDLRGPMLGGSGRFHQAALRATVRRLSVSDL